MELAETWGGLLAGGEHSYAAPDLKLALEMYSSVRKALFPN